MKVQIKEFDIQKIDYRKLVPIQKDLKFLDDAEYEKLKKSFEAKGYFIPIFVWRCKDVDYILDGHGRDKVFLKEKITFDDNGKETYEIPCLVVTADNEKDAREKLLIINSRYQQYNKDNEFIDNIDVSFMEDIVNIPDFNKDFDAEKPVSFAGDVDDGSEDVSFDEETEETPTNAESIYELKELVIFEKGLNKYDIPKLKNEMITTIPEPIQVYCGDGKTIEDIDGFWLFLQGAYHGKVSCSQGVLAFYSWDDRIEGVWKDTVGYVNRILQREYLSVITPNFSVLMEEPLAWCAWQVYRSRWVGRYFQEAGIPITPDITWTDERSFEYSFLGIDKGVPCVSIQTQNLDVHSKKSKYIYETGFKAMLSALEPKCIFIYGSPSTKAYILSLIPPGLKYIFVESWISKRRDKIKN